MITKYNIREFSLKELTVFFKDKNEKAFRAKQVFEWIWQKHVGSFEEMSNLSKSLRELLKDNFYINRIAIDSFQKSKDNTKKIAFKLADGALIEGVLIPVDNRITACISTQVGCKLGCKFCATGKLGFTRNLLAEEIYDQVVEIRKMAEKEYSSTLTNIVLMGMGEPLLNYDNVLKAMNMIISEEGMGMSPQRITLSTVGIPDMIEKLADDNVKFHLAVSLHSAIDSTRSKIMPINKKHSLDKLTKSLVYFNDKTGTRIIFEYLLMAGINDSISDAKALA
ncbi:MAG: 23S rRNA (adenine(2503)-C(2))-methyltransferase RlmN, partial [Bacteroidota bacterium]|nr:23S rRNA (adenine(2503)-C(2))-methyltransferase RlmN [Bacteroidota bacterium]